ncbi:hypothetical protein LDO26_05540 [Luteimonas sp. BDR2-5]|uniref:hypothetical protein n=1 Tax=Proluteimonas luteida TaxID=2878685 RepID=UPI001E33EC91|nr:hypothetical protein [Luteimonas sp. BDR2-5]MCD9027669.1 hypothetical protein [Luteimonas sp. BDR2-5]
MRQVFSSARLENVEGVANLLREAGIEVQITNGRSYKGNRRGNFSYRDTPTGDRPAVWVVRSDQQPQARELLRGAGLLQSLPSRQGYLPQADVVFAADSVPPKRRLSRAAKIRYVLLGSAVVVIGLVYLPRLWQGDDAPAPAAATPVAPDLDMVPPTVEASVHRIAVPAALAETVLGAELAAIDGPVCVAVDDADPAPALLARLQAARADLRAVSDCAAGTGAATTLAVDNYRTDGSGVGTVDVVTGDGGTPPSTRTLDVRREGRDWLLLPDDRPVR